jgi:hypothetical protein
VRERQRASERERKLESTQLERKYRISIKTQKEEKEENRIEKNWENVWKESRFSFFLHKKKERK